MVQTETGTPIEDLSIPKAVVARILRGTATAQLMMQKEAKDAFTKSVTVFISYISSQAAELAKRAGRKTISAVDVYDALAVAEFESFVAGIREITEAYNQNAREKRAAQTRNSRANKKRKDEEQVAEAVHPEAHDGNNVDF
ncbi:DNA polymerase epsilon subunit 3 [Entophlyctis sp. JEL0112]|nr:DNA polymerase epsilon subunit 3 [Entophlyctis sp. JEL0112]